MFLAVHVEPGLAAHDRFVIQGELDKRRMVMHHHPAFVKLTLDNESVMCGKAGLNVYSEEHIAVMKDFAARHVLPISGHCHRRFGFERALAHGISLEHSLGDSFITEQEAAIMAQKKMTIVPTITVGQLLARS